METITEVSRWPLSGEKAEAIVAQFHRDGYALVPAVLTPSEVADLREEIDAIFADPLRMVKHRHGFEFVAARLFDGEPMFQALLTREPIAGLVTAILGPGAEVVGLNAIRNPPTVSISNWHVDDVLEFPVPPDVARHDPRLRMPVQWMSVMIALSDIESVEYGPTQFLPGSHYAGRHPNDRDNPTFEDREVVSLFCRTGDMYLQNHQCWHRGAPNVSDRTRYILQLQFGQRWAIRRFTGIA